MKKNGYFDFTSLLCLFFLFLIICTQSFLLWAGGGDARYSYYELSGPAGGKVIIKLNTSHLPLDTDLLRDRYQLTVSSISAEEAASSGRHFLVAGGVMTSPLDGNEQQRRQIETVSVAGILHDGLSLYSGASQSRQSDAPEEQVEGRLEIDFAFQTGGNLGLMMRDIRQVLSELQRAGQLSDFRIRGISSYFGRRGSLLIEVISTLSEDDFCEQLSRRFAGYFIPRSSHRADRSLQTVFQQMQLSVATGQVGEFDTLQSRLREQMTVADQSGYMSIRSVETGAMEEAGHNQRPFMYLYRVSETSETASQNSEYFVLSGSSRLEDNPGQLPYQFTRIRNDLRFLSGVHTNLRNTVSLSDQGSAGGDEMSILFELLRREQTFQGEWPSDRNGYARYGYHLTFARQEHESVTAFVDRVVSSLGRLHADEYYEYTVSGVLPGEEQMLVLRITYIRYVRMNARQDRDNHLFIRRTRGESAVSEALLFQGPSFMSVPAQSSNTGFFLTLLRCFACQLGGRLCVTRTASPPAPSVELQNMNRDEEFGRRPSSDNIDRTTEALLQEPSQP